jgi:uncharacterized protein YbaR (Trm112 family)
VEVSVSDELLAILVCPACRGELDAGEDVLVCRSCGLHYPVKDGIPYMRPEDGYRPEQRNPS